MEIQVKKLCSYYAAEKKLQQLRAGHVKALKPCTTKHEGKCYNRTFQYPDALDQRVSVTQKTSVHVWAMYHVHGTNNVIE